MKLIIIAAFLLSTTLRAEYYGSGGSSSSGGISSLNSLTGSSQTIEVGTSGTDFAVSSSGTAHTLNLPTASTSNRGALSTTDWDTFNGKVSGPGSSTDNAIVRWNGTGGTSVQNTSQVTIDDNGALASTNTIATARTVTTSTNLLSSTITNNTSNSTADTVGIYSRVAGSGSIAASSNIKAAAVYAFTEIPGLVTNGIGYGEGAFGITTYVYGSSTSTSSYNTGLYADAYGSNHNQGVVANVRAAAGSSPLNVGVKAHVTSSGTTTVGLWSKLVGTFSHASLNAAPSTSAALLVDNGDVAVSIASFRDNDSEVFGIRDGGELQIGKQISTVCSSVSLTADDQAVTANATSCILLTSDNTTATSRTAVLGNGSRAGSRLTLIWNVDNASGAGELQDGAGSNTNLSATWTPNIGDTINLIWDGSDWVELSRSDN